jgi:hypothetical protein
MSGATAVRDMVVPGWLAEVVRPRRAPVPWPEMTRAALAICVPLSASYAAGRGTLGALGDIGSVTGLQLAVVGLAWSGWPDSNRRPPRPKIVMSVQLGC